MRVAFGWLAILVFASVAQAQQKEPKSVDVTWHGQSFFTISSSKGTVVAIDPHLIPEYGRIEGLKADLVLMSHNHNDHTQLGALANGMEKDIKVIPGLKTAGMRADWNLVDQEFKDLRVRNVGTYHDTSEGLERGKNTCFLVEVDGWKICHLGDLAHELTDDQLKKIGEVDVLMIPVGGVYALNGSEAKKVVAQIKPKEYIFPMHYGTKVYDDLLSIDEFLEGQKRENVARSDDNRLSLNRDPQRPRPLIVPLHYWPKKKDLK